MTDKSSHNLVELSKRTGDKPYEKLRLGDTYASERTIFQDTLTHAEIWKLTHDPHISRHIYYDIPAWNADGSLLFFVSRRPGQGDGNWLMDADGGRIWELQIQGEPGRAGQPLWSTHDPNLMYYASYRDDQTAFCALDVRTGEWRELASVEGLHGVRFCPPSSDEKKLLLKGREDLKKKEWTVYFIDIETGERREVPIEGNIHRLRFTRAPDYSIFFNLNDPVIETRLGSYLINADGSGLTELIPLPVGHPDWASDGHAWSYYGRAVGGIWVMDRDGTRRRQLVDLNAGMHGGWSFDGKWIVSDVTNRGPWANQIIMVHTEERGRIYRICSHDASYQGWAALHPDAESTHPAPISSPDGTKVVFDSDRIGRWGEVYTVAVRKPEPPTELQAEKQGDRVRLTWKRPERSKELAGYYVYRSDRSGEGFEQVGDSLVTEEAAEDTPPGTGPWFYRVTAVEHSSLEGRPSEEIRVGAGAWTEPVRRYVEPELGTRHGLVDQFDGSASNLYVLELKKRTESGYVELDLDLPKPASFFFWGRVSGETGKIGRWWVSCDGVDVGVCEAVVEEWSWVRALDEEGRPVTVDLTQGSHVLRISTSDEEARLDKLLVTDEPNDTPTGLGGLDTEPPSKVESVSVEIGGVSELDVSWEPVSDPDFHHYNVYASSQEDFECDQSTLIASPSEPRWIDWGLRPRTDHWSSTTYCYRITAADRTGNESESSEPVCGRTGVPRR